MKISIMIYTDNSIYKLVKIRLMVKHYIILVRHILEQVSHNDIDHSIIRIAEKGNAIRGKCIDGLPCELRKRPQDFSLIAWVVLMMSSS